MENELEKNPQGAAQAVCDVALKFFRVRLHLEAASLLRI
jgi:hypothetical protein